MPRLYVIAGHGASDPGASGNGYAEADLARKLAKRLGELGGAEVIVLDMGRNWFSDRGILSLDLPPGSQIVELHMDSGPRGARGGHVIIKPGKQPDGYDMALAALLSGMFPGRAESIREQSLANATRAAQRGYGYRLLECGFITDAEDVGTYVTHIDRLALGIMGAFGIAPTRAGDEKRGDGVIPILTGDMTFYRLYNPNSGTHHFAASRGERDMLVSAGWNDEGIGWRIAPGGTVPMYRLYNPNDGDHVYVPYEEAASLEDAGWRVELAVLVHETGKPVYRLYNPNGGEHHYTMETSERDHLVSVGWNCEGIGWYAA